MLTKEGLSVALTILFCLLPHVGFSSQPESRLHGQPEKKSAYAFQRDFMVKYQLEVRGIQDPRVLSAMRMIPRHVFVPPADRHRAYEDRPLPIGHGQTISQPYVVAAMTEALALEPGDRVLEIGTGSGYQAAVLAEMVKEVYSIEIIPEHAVRAKEQLQALGYSNVEVKQGDGYMGWDEYQPFDAIIVTAAPEKIPQKLLDQLKNPGGRMVVPVGLFYQELRLIRKTKEGLVEKKLFPVRFVPMVKKNEQSSDLNDS